jgi:hypothetical protein
VAPTVTIVLKEKARSDVVGTCTRNEGVQKRQMSDFLRGVRGLEALYNATTCKNVSEHERDASYLA